MTSAKLINILFFYINLFTVIGILYIKFVIF